MYMDNDIYLQLHSLQAQESDDRSHDVPERVLRSSERWVDAGGNKRGSLL
jgi:hypothetical protein